MPTDYVLHDIPDAKVLKFFMENYMKFADWLETSMQSVNKPDYTWVFTGHSLGGALTTHAATDVLLSGLHSPSKMRVYTFGHPRLANKAFDDALTNQVKDAYRVVHWKDLVAHVPPCIAKPVVGKSSCQTSGTLSPIYPYHTMTEVFYTEDESSYEICSTMEQRSCSN